MTVTMQQQNNNALEWPGFWISSPESESQFTLNCPYMTSYPWAPLACTRGRIYRTEPFSSDCKWGFKRCFLARRLVQVSIQRLGPPERTWSYYFQLKRTSIWVDKKLFQVKKNSLNSLFPDHVQHKNLSSAQIAVFILTLANPRSTSPQIFFIILTPLHKKTDTFEFLKTTLVETERNRALVNERVLAISKSIDVLKLQYVILWPKLASV